MPKPMLRNADFSQRASLAKLRARVIEQTRREPALTRSQLLLRQSVVMGMAVLSSLLLFGWLGGVRSGPRPLALVLQTAFGSAALALGSAIIAFGRGRSMLGRPRSWLLALIVLTPIALFSCRVLLSVRFPLMMAEWHGRPGLRCFAMSGALALAPLFGVLWLRRGTDPVHPRSTAAALAATVGAGSWVLVDLWCPVGFVPHLLLGHVLPLLLLIALGATLGARLVSFKPRR
jgi:hypothetical protein